MQKRRFNPDFIVNECSLEVFTKEILEGCQPFSCGKDEDMDDFFRNEVFDYSQFRVGKSFCFLLKSDPTQIVACFTLANDSLRIFDLPNARKNAMWKELSNREKMLARFPGVLIGRLAVSKDFSGVGPQVLEFIKGMFYEEDVLDKSAMRILLVDAKNTPKVLDFYERGGYNYLFPTELQEDLYTKPPRNEEEKAERLQNPRSLHTRLMYLDLLAPVIEDMRIA